MCMCLLSSISLLFSRFLSHVCTAGPLGAKWLSRDYIQPPGILKFDHRVSYKSETTHRKCEFLAKIVQPSPWVCISLWQSLARGQWLMPPFEWIPHPQFPIAALFSYLWSAHFMHFHDLPGHGGHLSLCVHIPKDQLRNSVDSNSAM